MRKKINSILVFVLALSAVVFGPTASADYPAISGLPLIAGSLGCPIAIDPTPKSIPANSRVASLSSNERIFKVISGKPTVLKFKDFKKLSNADSSIRCSNFKSSIYLGPVSTDSKGNLQLPAFGLFKPGVYTLVVKVGNASRTIELTV